MKRQRGRGRGNKPGGHHQPNRTLESSGPEIKVRGPASHIYERYLQLARDASSSGDRVMAENYLQHAEHYFRVLRAMQPAMPPPQADRFGNDMDFEGDDEGGEGEGDGELEGGEGNADQPDVEFPGDQQQRPQQQGGEFNNNRDDGFRRRRGRRNRYRSEGEGGFEGERPQGEQRGDRPQGERPQGEQRAERPQGEPRGERAERPQGEPRGERPQGEAGGERPQGEGRRARAPRGERSEGEQAPEGFSHGPKPAFLGSD